MIRVGIDVGGTFTDAVLVDGGGALHVAKVRSTPRDAARGFREGLEELARRSGHDAVDYLAHGTTVAANAIVQGRLARAGLIVNAGFRDILEIGTQQRRRIYDLWEPQPAPVIPRERCHEVRGRIGPDGAEVEPLAEGDVRAAAAALRTQGVEAVAVVLLFSVANDAHERRIAAILAEELPGVPVALSSEVAPELREYLRASTTALNAALLPVAGGYVRRLARVGTPLHLMQSNGGVAIAEEAARLPIGLVASGPAAGVIGAARLGAAVGERDLLTFDMGGTTADVALVIDGLPRLRFQGEHGGHPVNLPQIDVLSVGAGGGSIAAVDALGSLTVGPESAGADPGPASYGAGGTRPTVTDAHLVLGTLGAARALGGRVALDPGAARTAVDEHVARPLGVGVEAGAEAILRVATANMADALRVVSVARGHDPRELALVALGGAGPMHACAIAEDLGVPRVVVPRHPGVAAALGLLLSDVRHDLRRSWVAPTAEVDVAALDAAVAGLEARGRELLDGAAIDLELDMRYRGQAYNLTVPLPPRPVTAATLAVAEAAFHEAHRQAYDYTPAVTETEIVTIRAGIVDAAVWDGGAPASGAEAGRSAERGSVASGPAEAASGGATPGVIAGRDVWQAGNPRRYAVLERDALRPGDSIAERTLVEQEDATLVVPAGWRGEVGPADIVVLTR